MATVVFVSPHQDDEALSMGASIRKHLEATSNGVPVHDVHVLLLTCGSGSGAQAVVGLNDGDFAAARDDELVRATRALGVRRENVHFATNRVVGDTSLSVAEAQVAITAFVSDFPGAWVKTYSHRTAAGRHQDHVNTGQAALNLLNAGILAPNTLRMYVEPWSVSAFQTAYPAINLGTETCAAPARVRAALYEYEDEDHPGHRWGIGGISVPTYFDMVRANPVSRYHAP